MLKKYPDDSVEILYRKTNPNEETIKIKKLSKLDALKNIEEIEEIEEI